MDKSNKIYIKIQLEKDEATGQLVMKTRFDPTAPNFFHDKDEYSWCPTPEEMRFIYEAFELMPHQPLNYTPHVVPPSEEPSLEKEGGPTSAQPREEIPKVMEKTLPVKKDTDGVIVTADAAAVDEIIRKRRDGEGVIVEADENTIVDKVLKHKKRGTW